MSSTVRPPDPGAPSWRTPPPALLFGLRAALLLAYLPLAHLAGVRQDGTLAALALADVALIVLLGSLLQQRLGAWLALALLLPVLAWLARSPQALLPLQLVPAALVGLLAWVFGRSLRGGRVPLIGRIVAAIDCCPHPALAPELRRYTRRLTAAWAWLLGLLALANLALAACAVPGGLLAGFGIAPPLAVSQAQWSWFADVGNYGLVAGFFLLEFAWRRRRFPGRYRSFGEFLGKLARLGPGFWRDILR